MEELKRKSSRKREIWLEHNNIDNEENLERVLGYARLKIGKEDKVGYEMSPRSKYPTYLEIVYKTRKFKLEILEDEMCVVVLGYNKINNIGGKEKYHVVQNRGKKAKFYGQTCWEEALTFLGKKMRNIYKNF